MGEPFPKPPEDSEKEQKPERIFSRDEILAEFSLSSSSENLEIE